jgi:hypothetical protein
MKAWRRVWTDRLDDPGTRGEPAHDPSRLVTVEAPAVTSDEDRACGTLTDSQVDRPCGSRRKRGGHRLGALAQHGESYDPDLIPYAHAKQAILVTTNRDCAVAARRQRSAGTVWLQVRAQDATAAMTLAVDWLTANRLPEGRVLRVPRHADPRALSPTER